MSPAWKRRLTLLAACGASGLLIAFASGGLGQQAKGKPVAIIEAIDAPATGLQALQYLRQGQRIELGDGRITIAYFATCIQEEIVHGFITIGRQQSLVTSGRARRKQIKCDGMEIDLGVVRGGDGGVLVVRRVDAGAGDNKRGGGTAADNWPAWLGGKKDGGLDKGAASTGKNGAPDTYDLILFDRAPLLRLPADSRHISVLSGDGARTIVTRSVDDGWLDFKRLNLRLEPETSYLVVVDRTHRLRIFVAPGAGTKSGSALQRLVPIGRLLEAR